MQQLEMNLGLKIRRSQYFADEGKTGASRISALLPEFCLSVEGVGRCSTDSCAPVPHVTIATSPLVITQDEPPAINGARDLRCLSRFLQFGSQNLCLFD